MAYEKGSEQTTSGRQFSAMEKELKRKTECLQKAVNLLYFFRAENCPCPHHKQIEYFLSKCEKVEATKK
jgi:hypothetical protein